MSIGFGFPHDVPDDVEAGYANRVSQKYKYDWERNHTCECGAKIKWVTRDDGRRFAINLIIETRPGAKWLYRRQPDGRYSWRGSGPGYVEHACRGSR